MLQASPFGSSFLLCRGRIVAYDGYQGVIATTFPDGQTRDCYMHRDYVVPALPPHLNLCVGLEVVYEYHVPQNGGRPYSYKIQVTTPLPWGPPTPTGATALQLRDAPANPMRQQTHAATAALPSAVVGVRLPGPGPLATGPSRPDINASCKGDGLSTGPSTPPSEQRGWWPVSTTWPARETGCPAVGPTAQQSSYDSKLHGNGVGRTQQQGAAPPATAPLSNHSNVLSRPAGTAGSQPELPSQPLPPPPPLPNNTSMAAPQPTQQPFTGPFPPPLPLPSLHRGAPPAGHASSLQSAHGSNFPQDAGPGSSFGPGTHPARRPYGPVPHLWQGRSGPQRAPQPPVPHMPVNMPYISHAARQPLPAKPLPRRPEPQSRWEPPRRNGQGHQRPARRRSSRSPGRRRGGVIVEDVRRKAAAVAEAYVKNRRRSSAAADLPAWQDDASSKQVQVLLVARSGFRQGSPRGREGQNSGNSPKRTEVALPAGGAADAAAPAGSLVDLLYLVTSDDSDNGKGDGGTDEDENDDFCVVEAPAAPANTQLPGGGGSGGGGSGGSRGSSTTQKQAAAAAPPTAPPAPFATAATAVAAAAPPAAAATAAAAAPIPFGLPLGLPFVDLVSSESDDDEVSVDMDLEEEENVGPRPAKEARGGPGGSGAWRLAPGNAAPALLGPAPAAVPSPPLAPAAPPQTATAAAAAGGCRVVDLVSSDSEDEGFEIVGERNVAPQGKKKPKRKAKRKRGEAAPLPVAARSAPPTVRMATRAQRQAAAAAAKSGTGGKGNAGPAMVLAVPKPPVVPPPVVRGAAVIKIYCSDCGKAQAWDAQGDHAKPLPDPSALDRVKRNPEGQVVYDAQGSLCTECGTHVLRNPLSAVCTHCDTIMPGFRPTYWKCSNKDGKGIRRVMAGATAAGSRGPCKYAQTCAHCVDHDLRYPGRPNCACPRLHCAHAGQTKVDLQSGHLGWVLLH